MKAIIEAALSKLAIQQAEDRFIKLAAWRDCRYGRGMGAV